MATAYKNEGHFATVARQRARRAVVAGKARWLHSRPKAVEAGRYTVRERGARGGFGSGILASRPSYRLDCTISDHEWWAEESRREEDREIERMYAEFRAQERMERGLDPY